MSDQAPVQPTLSTNKQMGWTLEAILRTTQINTQLSNAGMSVEEIKTELAKRKPKPLRVVHIDEQFKKGIG